MVNKQETKENIKIIKKVARTTKDKGLARKLLGIRLVFQRCSIKKAADIADLCEKTIYTSLKQYEEGGISALIRKPMSGRKTKLIPDQESGLYNTIRDKLPSEVGFEPFANWTAPLAMQWIRITYGVQFSERGVRNLLDRIGLSYTRPTYTLKKADPIKQEEFRQAFEGVKKT